MTMKPKRESKKPAEVFVPEMPKPKVGRPAKKPKAMTAEDVLEIAADLHGILTGRIPEKEEATPAHPRSDGTTYCSMFTFQSTAHRAPVAAFRLVTPPTSRAS